MAQVTKTERIMEAAIAAHAQDPERVLLLERAKRFKRTWIELAEVLVKAREAETFRPWGYGSFEDYYTRELHLRRGTVDKLCASYGFLRAHAPRVLKEDEDVARPIPSWQAVDFLARAESRGAVDDDTLNEMKRAVFEEGASSPSLSRKYKEVAFPMADDERKVKARGAIVAAARRLADLIGEDGNFPKKLGERVKELVQDVEGWAG
jgi:hypothetical protein